MPVVLAPVLIPVFALLLCLLLWAMTHAGETFFRALFQVLSGSLGRLPGIGFLVRRSLDWMIAHVIDPISRMALGMEDAIVGFLHGVASAIESFVWSVRYVALRTYDAFNVLRHATIPRLLRAAVQPITKVVHVHGRAIPASLRELVGTIPRLWAYARSLAGQIAHDGTVAGKAFTKAEAAAVPAIVTWAPQQIGFTRKQLARVLRKIRALPEWLTVAGVGAVAVYALSRIGAGWLRCSNWQKIGRSGCRLPSRWLDDLLSLAADFLIVSNICMVIPWLETAFSEVAAPLVAVLTRAGAGICRGGAGAPELLPPPGLQLPAVADSTLYLP